MKIDMHIDQMNEVYRFRLGFFWVDVEENVNYTFKNFKYDGFV